MCTEEDEEEKKNNFNIQHFNPPPFPNIAIAFTFSAAVML